MSSFHAARQRKRAFRRQRSPEGRFVILNATVLVLHIVLTLAAKPLLAADVAGRMSVGVLLLLGHGLFLLWTARRYTSASASMSRRQT